MQVSLELCLQLLAARDGPLSLRLAVETKEIVQKKLELMGDNLDNLDEKQSLKPCRIVNQYC